MTIGKYLCWKDEHGDVFRPVSLTGTELLNDRTLNKSTAFTYEERKAFQLNGLLPPRVQTFRDQLDRVYDGFRNASTDIEKYLFLRSLQDRNETLFYALLSRHVEEMTPIIYTPTVGKACQEFSHRYQKARGLYVTEDNVNQMGGMARQFGGKEIKIIVVTDSQGILGIGDQGVGGMGIPIGKLSLYTLGAGIHPAHCLPIVLDVGTDNQNLLNDPMYLGTPRLRMRGEEYKRFIKRFVKQVTCHFPNAILQWEDFSKSNAFDNLSDYENILPSFNDDIQGTGSVVLAGILGACKIKQEKLSDQTYVVYGAGAGGIGVAHQIYAGLLKEGSTHQAAKDKIFVLDSHGLVFEDREGLDEYKKFYAKPRSIAEGWKTGTANKVTLIELINHHPITVLLGTSGVGGAFKAEHVQKMMEYSACPTIFPLSNPTANCEADPDDLYHWSDGQAIIATGSPFTNVRYQGREFRIGQGNNVFIFPGVGLASIVSNCPKVTLGMFTTASYALAGCVSEKDLEKRCVYPRIQDLRTVSTVVAKVILEDIRANDPTSCLHGRSIEEELARHMWEPVYIPYRRV
ncbi:NAD-dependent malic enzyme [Candidatus Enterovibrio escicola]|uniref:NAD-dependent malic enzyme n=2 Tax=Candidatus Enterovibrio escicola TaxID=1927127 RepID=A0A2A5T2V7_9GAMM|nr:NAD-dependent malic enzyme [Candidatus Enterovibrio escacola]PCS22471.1 NAD-dependent malic enzyme [Candidatus Enterovibrio escacola]